MMIQDLEEWIPKLGRLCDGESAMHGIMFQHVS